jgi:exoribonuclease R
LVYGGGAVLQEIVEQVRQSAITGERPVVVLDLDSTLIHTGARHLAIAQDFAAAEPALAPFLEGLGPDSEAHALAQQLRQNRMQAGALDLEVPECEVLLDGTGRMTRIRINPSDASHQMIEECMVAANEAVATELASRGIKILSRLHEPPDPEKIAEVLSARLKVKPWLSPGLTSWFVNEAMPVEKGRPVSVVKNRTSE